ncbi:hormogonium polysaccharide biosynthesis protein HpsA [Nostoc sp.]|uniref:hormogonium polysaccharide biosynthesis protein HpsA n=1 Tax=Nostoc sp. TaxID=1180 RepID=UPI002FF67D83
MYRKRQLFKVIQKNFRQISKQFLSAINKQIIWLLRAIYGNRRRRGSENAGFLLPTVAMVSLVVVLLTTAILFRSFERSKNASNVRVNQAVLNAAAPALDRARAKLDKLFTDSRLPRAVPSDKVLEDTLSSTANLPEFTFGDETPLKLNYAYSTSTTPTKPATEDQPAPLTTAWMFPIDTNNNGKFDSYTLYGIYFRTPPITPNGRYSRPRNPLEARTPPMTSGSVSSSCKNSVATSAALVGSTGWVNIAGQLQKSFFVYTANVPITNPPATGNYEAFTGNKGFSGLEYQQDRVQLPLVNNAVVYNDDIELTPGPAFNLNGRVLTNSNFLTGSNNVRLYQVSSVNSCFYSEDNAKIFVGGNLGAGDFIGNASSGTLVDLFQGQAVSPSQNGNTSANTSVTDGTSNIAYNSLAYAQRINLLVLAQTSNAASTDPQQVQDAIIQQLKLLNLTTATASAAQQSTVRNNQLVLYFQDRTRRVPYGEVAFGGNAIINPATSTNYTNTTVLQGSGKSLRPQDTWVYPFLASDGKTKTNYSNLTLNTNSTKLLPGATQPVTQQTLGKEQYVGDRILLGNNLPALWWNGTAFVGQDVTTDTQDIKNVNWDSGSGTRTRSSRVQQLADLGTVDRDGDWEVAAATVPTTVAAPVGGLRVVTGAGIYLPQTYTVSSTQVALNLAAAATNRIWSDMMPVPNTIASGINPDTYKLNIVLPNLLYTPYLRMRATAVYHYQATGYSATNPKPIACISSFYDPTNSTTAKNLAALPYNNNNGNVGGNSHNGIVYAPPTKAVSDYSPLINYQANLMYPNGRLVNPILNTAMGLVAASGTLTISQQSAIDASICAIQILDGTIGAPSNSVIPHGAISENAFLDARQIKAIHKDVQIDTTVTTVPVGNIIPGRETFTNADGVNGDGTGTVANPSTDYELAKETRQPLEIRATVLDYDALGNKLYGTATPQEYLIPNSGIIYATRDDALPDLSYPAGILAADTATQKQTKKDTQKSQSPVDYKLDPTRRPNAIMLKNGDITNNPNGSLWRVQAYRDAEKGLVLASNLPVYILGNFNKHSQEEFITPLASNLGNFYSRSDLNPNFACRTGDPRLPNCTTGDDWRPASVLADAITLLSTTYQTGYRSDGDYDLNNNLGDTNSTTTFQSNGFANNNANVVNAAWYGSDGLPLSSKSSSYLNNFVTPIQRRKTAPEYLMEVCPKLPVSACDQGNDWYVTVLPDVLLKASNVIGQTFSLATHKAGTTAQAQLPTGTNSQYLGYPRRVAFLRNASGQLTLDSNNKPIIIGIDNAGKITSFPFSTFSSSHPRNTANSLWFYSNNSDNNPPTVLSPAIVTTPTTQPALSPVLQIRVAFSTTNENASDVLGSGAVQNSYWLQWATSTTFNLAAAGADTPARPTEDNGGLHNFVRLLENWNPSDSIPAYIATINGSFIQRTRSAYATAPFLAYLNGSSLTPYPTNNSGGKLPYYQPPTRQWGYDVGLLSQSPDAFSQKLAITPNNKPNEYFREVGRDDTWVQTLLCAKKADSTYAVDADQRPGCS